MVTVGRRGEGGVDAPNFARTSAEKRTGLSTLSRGGSFRPRMYLRDITRSAQVCGLGPGTDRKGHVLVKICGLRRRCRK